MKHWTIGKLQSRATTIIFFLVRVLNMLLVQICPIQKDLTFIDIKKWLLVEHCRAAVALTDQNIKKSSLPVVGFTSLQAKLGLAPIFHMHWMTRFFFWHTRMPGEPWNDMEDLVLWFEGCEKFELFKPYEGKGMKPVWKHLFWTVQRDWTQCCNQILRPNIYICYTSQPNSYLGFMLNQE